MTIKEEKSAIISVDLPAVWQAGRWLSYIKPIKQIRSVSIISLILIFSPATVVYASEFKGPWGLDNSQKLSQKKVDRNVNPLRFLVEAYRKYISPIDGRNCPMYPSCSKYSLQCFKKHGLFIGWMMTCDRLFRCGRDELRLSPQIIVNGNLNVMIH